jgi:hypothetical protein
VFYGGLKREGGSVRSKGEGDEMITNNEIVCFIFGVFIGLIIGAVFAKAVIGCP